MKKVTYLVLSDTHVPDRAPRVPENFLEYLAQNIDRYDAVIHLGDFTSLETYRLFKHLAGDRFVAVLGNMDDYELGKLLKKIEILEPFPGFRVFCFHSDIVPRGFHPAIAEVGKRFGAKLVLYGHTHKPEALQYAGLVLVNPGSLTNGSIRGYPNTFAEITLEQSPENSKVKIIVKHLFTENLKEYRVSTFALQ
jgi:putative phosphoesterase